MPTPKRKSSRLPATTRTVGAVALLAASGAFAFTLAAIDWPGLQSIRAETLAEGDRAISADGSVSLLPPSDGWSQVAPGTIADDDAMIELIDASGVSWVVVYELDGTEPLHDHIAARRDALRDNGPIRTMWERTSFWSETSFERMTRGSYTVGDGAIIREHFEIQLVENGPRVIEVIAFTTLARPHAPNFEGMFESLEFGDE